MINTDKEKIIAEIKRLKSEAFNKINHDARRSLVTDVANSQRIAICEQLLDFINSLPVEHQSEDLEEEIKRKYESNIGLMMPIEDFRKLILHFTNWQKNQTINKAYDWLNDNFYQYGEDGTDNNGTSLLYDFKKAMEE